MRPGGGRPGGGGQPNLKQLMRLQQQLTTVQAELAEAEVTGTAGGGLVTVTMTAERVVRGVSIDPKAVDPDDVETLEDLVVAALHNATEAAQALHDEKMKPFSSMVGGLGLPGF